MKLKIYQDAAKKVMRDIRKHMKKDGWPLDFGFHVDDVFYEAHKHHLENYLLELLFKDKKVALTINAEKGAQIVKRKGKKTRPRKAKRKSNTK